MIEFDPQPEPGSRPLRFASPFQVAAPHELARRAAASLQAELRERDLPELAEPGGGKMFGVLVVSTPEGRVAHLRGFSGMLTGRWQVEGFVPPVFDLDALAEFWPAGMAALAELELEHRDAASRAAIARAALDAAIEQHRVELAELRVRQRESRARRHLARSSGAESQPLDQQSRAEGAERRRFDAAWRARQTTLAATLAPLDARVQAIEARRAARSQQLFERLHQTYAIANARGEQRSLRSLFAPRDPPGGAGDCAAPKLLAEAYRRGLRPLALAEFWWGPTNSAGRRSGEFYPACRGKCGPILPFMLGGLEGFEGSEGLESEALFGADSGAIADPRVLFEDAAVIVVDKPAGLLSVPGRHERLRDSVMVRLAARFEPFIVHRLDLDTSGLMLVAKDRQTHAALQKQFALRSIGKRYIAWLAGSPTHDRGRVELSLRVDPDDRPRQIHDPDPDSVHGKRALTDWQVLERSAGRTRVALVPHTGRTHQLRVHAAHPLGIGVAIVGDRLYGQPDVRLLLHAETLAFDHPQTGARIELHSPAPF